MVVGSKEWLVALRDGAFANRPPVPWQPPAREPRQWKPGTEIERTTMPSKYRQMVEFNRANGTPCAYCRRPMDCLGAGTHPTRDHVHPKSKGGRMTVWACQTCNHMKADMTLDEWTAFMAANPNWWNGMPKVRKSAPRQNQLAVIPYEESIYILKHGKKAYLAWKAAAGAIPTEVPKRYDDPAAQAAFENVYRNRLGMLRTPESVAD